MAGPLPEVWMAQAAKPLPDTSQTEGLIPKPPPPLRPDVPRDIRSLSLSLLAVLAVLLTLWLAKDVFLPVVIAVLISYALSPPVNWFAAHKVPRWLSSAVLLLGIVALLGFSAYSLADQMSAILEKLPNAAQKVRLAVQEQHLNSAGPLDNMQKAASEIQKAASEATGDGRPQPRPTLPPPEPVINVKAFLWSGSIGALAVVSQFIMILFLVYFLLASGNLFKRKLVKIAGPSLESKKVTVQILDTIVTKIERFLLLQVFISALVGIASWVALRWIGLEQAGVWAIASALFTWIPYFGPAVITAVIAVIGFLQFGTFAMAGLIAGVLLAIRTVEGMLLMPWLAGRVGNLNAVAVFIGLLFWGWLWGAWGLLLAAPLMMVIKVVCDHVEGLRPIAEILAD